MDEWTSGRVDEIKVGFAVFPCFWPPYCGYNMKTTSPSYSNLEQQRQGLLRQLADLRELRRGSLTEQFLTVKHADGSSVKRGPYPLLTRKQARKTVQAERALPVRPAHEQPGPTRQRSVDHFGSRSLPPFFLPVRAMPPEPLPR